MVAHADRMMPRVQPREEGIEVVFVDGCAGVIPFQDIPEVGGLPELRHIELPNAYEIVLTNTQGETVELGWDFARHYCDASYRPRVEAAAAAGRQHLGRRVRELREAANLSQEALAANAGIGRATLARIEKGQHSARYDTLVALAGALGVPATRLFAPF